MFCTVGYTDMKATCTTCDQKSCSDQFPQSRWRQVCLVLRIPRWCGQQVTKEFW